MNANTASSGRISTLVIGLACVVLSGVVVASAAQAAQPVLSILERLI